MYRLSKLNPVGQFLALCVISIITTAIIVALSTLVICVLWGVGFYEVTQSVGMVITTIIVLIICLICTGYSIDND